MKKTATALAFIAASALSSQALASGSHAGGHGEVSIGEAGDKKKATQTIRITMKETDDGKMIFTPATIKVRQGQTVHFAIKNAGELAHEFVLDDKATIQEHKMILNAVEKGVRRARTRDNGSCARRRGRCPNRSEPG